MQHPDTGQPGEDAGIAIALVLRTIVNRRWVILLTASVVTLSAIGLLLILPNRYQSEATLLVINQQVPERYVVPTTTTTVNDALQALTREVLSRRRLLAVIDEHGLYSGKRNSLAPEQLIEMMTRDIDIEPLEPGKRGRGVDDFNAFRIAYTGEDPVVVQKVASTLTSLFIQENLRNREEQATSTTTFLGEQLLNKKKRLDEVEQRLRDFKMDALGELPEQQQGNLAILNGLQIQMQHTMTKIGAAQQQRVYLESLLAAYLPAGSTSQNGEMTPNTFAAPVGAVPLTDSIAAELAKLQIQRKALLSVYTGKYPDVEKLTREIDIKEAALEVAKAEEAKAGASGPRLSSDRSHAAPHGMIGEPAAIAQLQSQLEANRVEVANLAKDEDHLKSAIALYQSRINNTPMREQQLAGIIREAEALRQEYADLQRKEQESQLARDLEKNQRGRQFRLVDAPSFPTLPVSPKRRKLSGVAACAGVALGFVFAFALEMRSRSFATEEELRKHFTPSVPLIVAMPVVRTAEEQRIVTWKRVGEGCAGVALITIVGLAVFYIARFG